MNNRRILILVILIAGLLIHLTAQTNDFAYENTEVFKYLPLIHKSLYIASWGKDSGTLKCEAECLKVTAKSYFGLNTSSKVPWRTNDWLCVRIALPEDSIYSEHIKVEMECKQKNLTERCMSTPLVINAKESTRGFTPFKPYPGSAPFIDHLFEASLFSINITDSSALAVSVDTLFDGKAYPLERHKKNLDRSAVKAITYRVGVTTASVKCPNYSCNSNYFSIEFGSYPIIRVFHLSQGFGLLTLQGREVNGDGTPVHETVFNGNGVQTRSVFHDLSIGDMEQHKTEYSIDNGVLKRKITEVDKNGRPDYYKAVWRGMWMPDN
jgi:hypothetical protein